jgi:putative transposase
LTPHSVYLALGREDSSRLAAYRALFRSELDQEAVDDIRLAEAHGQPLGGEKFKQSISLLSGVRRVRTLRGRPVKESSGTRVEDQTDFGF